MKTFANLPYECILEIFLHFEDNYSTLYKCLVVCQLWCKLVVPILWRRPFPRWRSSFQRVKNNWNSLNRTYIAALNEDEKEILHPFDKRFNFPRPFFQYTSYLEKFSFTNIAEIIMNGWKMRNKQIDLFQNKHVKRLRRIMTAILQLVLRTSRLVEIEMFDYYSIWQDRPFFCDVLNVIPFFSYQLGLSKLRNLTIHFESSTYYKELLRNLSKSCINLQRLEYKIKRYTDTEIMDTLADIITAQSNLEEFWIDVPDIVDDTVHVQERFMNRLYSQKESLTSLSLHYIDFTSINPNRIAEYTKLETMEICNCYGATKDSYQVFLQSPVQLKSLTFDTNYFEDTFLAGLIEKAGKNLMNLYTDEVSEKIIMSLSQFCPNISKFTLLYKGKNCSMVMNYLKGSMISQLAIKSRCNSNKLLSVLGKYVPSSLEKIYFYCDFEAVYLGKFLKHVSYLEFDSLKTLYIEDIMGRSYNYLNVINGCTTYSFLKIVVIASTIDIDESSYVVQDIRKKGIKLFYKYLS
ncbi:2064_t:CDS:1 [Acaulospora morrowiae]|uniref:2064_t:CDS:1 n=1 Tax=Acaulospora morrowiae TaxID=94023 RepID=A0A9N9ENI8_9GLOM|nr:2064_t:CDS:1 [Acaulospora morrowiae]